MPPLLKASGRLRGELPRSACELLGVGREVDGERAGPRRSCGRAATGTAVNCTRWVSSCMQTHSRKSSGSTPSSRSIWTMLGATSSSRGVPPGARSYCPSTLLARKASRAPASAPVTLPPTVARLDRAPGQRGLASAAPVQACAWRSWRRRPGRASAASSRRWRRSSLGAVDDEDAACSPPGACSRAVSATGPGSDRRPRGGRRRPPAASVGRLTLGRRDEAGAGRLGELPVDVRDGVVAASGPSHSDHVVVPSPPQRHPHAAQRRPRTRSNAAARGQRSTPGGTRSASTRTQAAGRPLSTTVPARAADAGQGAGLGPGEPRGRSVPGPCEAVGQGAGQPGDRQPAPRHRRTGASAAGGQGQQRPPSSAAPGERCRADSPLVSTRRDTVHGDPWLGHRRPLTACGRRGEARSARPAWTAAWRARVSVEGVVAVVQASARTSADRGRLDRAEHRRRPRVRPPGRWPAPR